MTDLKELAAELKLTPAKERKYFSVGALHSEDLRLKLIILVKRDPLGTPAHRLWAAADELLSVSLRMLLTDVGKGMQGVIRDETHWAEFVDTLEDECQDFAHMHITGEPPLHPFGRDLIRHYAAATNDEPEAVYSLWCAEGLALRETLIYLKIELPVTRRRPKSSVIGVCELCWRTGFPSYKGKMFCDEHAQLGKEYHRAWRRSTWRDKSQKNVESRESFVWFWVREVRSRLHTAYRAELTDFGPLHKLAVGVDVAKALNDAQMWGSSLTEHWEHFPRTRTWLERHEAKPQLSDPMQVLAALDPIGPQNPALQLALHQILATDHRLLYDRIIYVEACLEADRRMRSNRGPKANSGDGKIVVPYPYGI